MKTFEETRQFLAEKFSKEKKRLKSFKTPTNSFDLANAVTRHVQAMCTDARHRELIRLVKHVPKLKHSKYINERLTATSSMAKAIKNVADADDVRRPWKYKSKTKEKKRGHTH
jgi:hypothetical protein